MAVKPDEAAENLSPLNQRRLATMTMAGWQFALATSRSSIGEWTAPGGYWRVRVPDFLGTGHAPFLYGSLRTAVREQWRYYEYWMKHIEPEEAHHV